MHSSVLITDSTRALLPEGLFEFEERPPVPLKGKRTQVKLWVPRARSFGSRLGDGRARASADAAGAAKA